MLLRFMTAVPLAHGANLPMSAELKELVASTQTKASIAATGWVLGLAPNVSANGLMSRIRKVTVMLVATCSLVVCSASRAQTAGRPAVAGGDVGLTAKPAGAASPRTLTPGEVDRLDFFAQLSEGYYCRHARVASTASESELQRLSTSTDTRAAGYATAALALADTHGKAIQAEQDAVVKGQITVAGVVISMWRHSDDDSRMTEAERDDLSQKVRDYQAARTRADDLAAQCVSERVALLDSITADLRHDARGGPIPVNAVSKPKIRIDGIQAGPTTATALVDLSNQAHRPLHHCVFVVTLKPGSAVDGVGNEAVPPLYTGAAYGWHYVIGARSNVMLDPAAASQVAGPAWHNPVVTLTYVPEWRSGDQVEVPGGSAALAFLAAEGEVSVWSDEGFCDPMAINMADTGTAISSAVKFQAHKDGLDKLPEHPDDPKGSHPQTPWISGPKTGVKYRPH